MKYSIRKISKKVGRFEEFQDVICVCASDGENVSVIAEIYDNEIVRRSKKNERLSKNLPNYLGRDIIEKYSQN